MIYYISKLRGTPIHPEFGWTHPYHVHPIDENYMKKSLQGTFKVSNFGIFWWCESIISWTAGKRIDLTTTSAVVYFPHDMDMLNGVFL